MTPLRTSTARIPLPMLDKLPLELLDHVLDLLPPSSTDKGARERTDTLLACCLVSKRVYERALPVLWRAIRLESEEQVSELLALVEAESEKDLTSGVRSLVVTEDDEEYLMPLKDAPRLLVFFSGLRRLRMDGAGAVDLGFLATKLPGMSLSPLFLQLK
jgi:hypothetical protein